MLLAKGGEMEISMQKFEYEETPLKDLKIIYSRFIEDERGYFLKSFEKESLKAIGVDIKVSEINESKSARGVLRGLHFQKKHPQAKLVRVISGEIFDVGVDLREGSVTYGQWYGVVLSETNRKMLYLPKGFAHGFLTLSENAVITYTCEGEYIPEDDCGICWNDEEIGVHWPISEDMKLVLSEKDRQWKTLKETFGHKEE